MYEEDYEDMTERVRQWLEESEWGNGIMDITKEDSVLPHHGVLGLTTETKITSQTIDIGALDG